MRSSIPLLHFAPSHLLACTEDLLARTEKGTPDPAPIRVLVSESMPPGHFALLTESQLAEARARILGEP